MTIFIPTLKVTSDGELVPNDAAIPVVDLNAAFSQAKVIPAYRLANCFCGCSGISGEIAFPKLVNVGDYGMYRAFSGTQLSAVSFPELKTVGCYGMMDAFAYSAITEVSFPNLVSIAAYGMAGAFYQTSLSSCTFPVLETVESLAFSSCFRSCSELKALYFPKLKNFTSGSFNGMCGTVDSSAAVAVHFPKAMATAGITASTISGISPTALTIYYDL